MRKLMSLELKKYKIGGYIRGALIANVAILGMVLLMIHGVEYADEAVFTSFSEVFIGIDMFVRGTFIVFAAVLLSRFIIDEFKNKSITVLFMYPINRKKLILAKLIIVFLFTFLSIIISDLLVSGAILAINEFTHKMSEPLTASIMTEASISFGMNALAASCMSLIPLYFGMRKYSTVTTITTSLLIIMIVCSNNGGVSLNNIIIIPITLAIIGVFVAYAALRNIEHVDVIK
nr:ABC transporter permease [Paenibacillus sp. OSY-SE]